MKKANSNLEVIHHENTVNLYYNDLYHLWTCII